MLHVFNGLIVISILLLSETAQSQPKKYRVHIVGFYNIENLFDTIDDPQTFDEDYTLKGKNRYSSENYQNKIKNTADVISKMGATVGESGPAIVGLAEIENFHVLNDLVHSEGLRQLQYQIIHFDSPDRRGIDVALIYRQAVFLPLETETIEVKLWTEKGERIYTRDILYVNGILAEEEIHIIVNHWPSRRGGKTRSEPRRIKSAYMVNRLTNRIRSKNPEAKILILGDFNDDPIDTSIKNILAPTSSAEENQIVSFFNPMEIMFKKGWNTLAYRDALHLFDQIILSKTFLGNNNKGLRYYKAGIFNPSYLIQQYGKYKGYPLRSFENNRYSGGYSDHFPVFIKLIGSTLDQNR
jgi:endonuclease/exonuclease/phosphatase family metal-dependent hydrolase